MSEEKPKHKWVEVIKYSEDFTSEEEARRFIEEADQFFQNIHRVMRRHFQSMLDLFDELWMPTFRRTEPHFYTETASRVDQRLTELERDVKEIKDLLKSKYIKKKKEEKEVSG